MRISGIQAKQVVATENKLNKSDVIILVRVGRANHQVQMVALETLSTFCGLQSYPKFARHKVSSDIKYQIRHFLM